MAQQLAASTVLLDVDTAASQALVLWCRWERRSSDTSALRHPALLAPIERAGVERYRRPDRPDSSDRARGLPAPMNGAETRAELIDPLLAAAGAMTPSSGDGRASRLVIGIGNPLRGDDGVGELLAEQAAVITAAEPGGSLAVRSVQQLTPELAEELAHLEAVLFIDAWQAPAGSVPQLIDLSPEGNSADGPEARTPDSHRLEPAALLAVSQALYGRAPRAQLLLVPATAFEHGTALSAELREALPQARALLRRWLSTSG